MFSPVQKSSEARGKEYDQVWGRVFNSIILNVITDAPPTTERKKNPLCLLETLCVSAFLLLDLEDAWRFCCFWGGRSAPRWKEERVLVGAEALHFKPYKISDAPQSQTSNRQRVVERRRTGWSWVERIWLSVLRASRAGCCSEVSRRVAEQKHNRKILYTRFISFGRWHVSEEGNLKFLFCTEVVDRWLKVQTSGSWFRRSEFHIFLLRFREDWTFIQFKGLSCKKVDVWHFGIVGLNIYNIWSKNPNEHDANQSGSILTKRPASPTCFAFFGRVWRRVLWRWPIGAQSSRPL